MLYLCQVVYHGFLDLESRTRVDVMANRLWIYRTLVEITRGIGDLEAVNRISALFRHEVSEAKLEP